MFSFKAEKPPVKDAMQVLAEQAKQAGQVCAQAVTKEQSSSCFVQAELAIAFGQRNVLPLEENRFKEADKKLQTAHPAEFKDFYDTRNQACDNIVQIYTLFANLRRDQLNKGSQESSLNISESELRRLRTNHYLGTLKALNEQIEVCALKRK